MSDVTSTLRHPSGGHLTGWRTSLNLPGQAVCTCASYISKSHLRRFLWGLGFLALGTLTIKAPRRHLLPVPINTLTMLHKHPIGGWICVQRSLPAHLYFIPKENEARTS